MKFSDVYSQSRHAGDVKRYHNYPTSRVQTNAEHSWNVARIWLSIFAPEDVTDQGNVLAYIIHHDSGELGLGFDAPFTSKRAAPDLKEICDRLEAKSLAEQGIRLPVLTTWEKASVKVCDLIEMMEFGHEELRRGCQYGEPVFEVTKAAIREILSVGLNGVIFRPESQQFIKMYVRQSMGVQL
jgi:5'-deoxynucleotidase YfbR-like HD superfamily hydrolase